MREKGRERERVHGPVIPDLSCRTKPMLGDHEITVDRSLSLNGLVSFITFPSPCVRLRLFAVLTLLPLLILGERSVMK